MNNEYSIFNYCDASEFSNFISLGFKSVKDSLHGEVSVYTIEQIENKFNDDIKFIILRTLYEKDLLEKYEDKKNPLLFAIRDIIYMYYKGNCAYGE